MTQYNYTACSDCGRSTSLSWEPKAMLYIQQKSVLETNHTIQENGGVILLG